MASGKSYKDEDWLRVQIEEKYRTLGDIADECGVHRNTIDYWKDKFDIEIQRNSKLDPHKEEIVNRYKDGEPSSELADDFGAEPSTILRFLKRNGIEVRDNAEAHRVKYGEYVPMRLHTPVSYERWYDQIAEDEVYVHQLLAISEGADPKEVFSGGEMVVHHRNELRWDNRPENIEVLSSSDHAKEHRLGLVN